MVQFNDLPSEIVAEVFKSIPLSDLYFSLDAYAPIIDPYVCVITDCLDSKFTKLLKNVIQITDFYSKFDELTGISFIILHIVEIGETLNGGNYSFLQNVYKILKERRKDTIFIIENLNTLDSVDDAPFDEELIILRFGGLFNTFPHNNLLVMKNIVRSQELPWNLNIFLNKSSLSTKDLQYLFRNLVIEDIGFIMVESGDFFGQKLASSLINNNEADIIDESIIFKGIKGATMFFPIDIEVPFQEKVHGRLFDVLNANIESIESLDIFDTRLNNNVNHVCYHLNPDYLLAFAPRLFDRITRLEIMFDYKTVLNNLSFPKLESFEVFSSEGPISDLPLIVNNVYMPKLKYLNAAFESSSCNLFLTIRITDSYILQFGNYNYVSDKIEPHHTTKLIEDDKMCYYFSAFLDFELSRKIRRLELKSPTLEIFNRMINERSDFTFDGLEELHISCFIHSKTDQFLNEPITDTFTHKKLYTKLKKLNIDIISGGDPIQVTTLDSGNMSVLEHLSIKSSWESFNSIRGLQVISLPKFSFINLRVLELEDLILPNFRDLNLPNVKHIHLKDVYENEVFSGLSIVGELPNLETMELRYTDRKTMLKEKASPDFQIEMDRNITIYLSRWVKLLPTITMEKAVYDRLSDLKYSKETVVFNLI